MEGDHRRLKTLCILDTAAAQSTIDEDFAKSLGIAMGENKRRTLAYLDREVSLTTSSCSIRIHSQDGSFNHLLKAEAVKGFSRNCILWPWSNFLCNHPHLRDLKVPTTPLPPVGTILIGTDNPDLLQALEYRRSSKPDRPMGIRTLLGWGFFGPDPPGEDTDPRELAEAATPNCSYKTTNTDLVGLLNRQFEIENLGALERDSPPTRDMIPGPKSPALWLPEERLADALMTVKRVEQKGHTHFEGSIPWKKGHHSKLIGNFHVVLQRQTKSHSESSLRKKGVTLSEIEDILEKYLEKGYIEPVPELEKRQGWYLPFFEVINREKSTPVRLVFDAKAGYRGTSLNQQILDTPNRLNDLTIILARMRHYRYFLAGDITEMFLQIRLNPEDKPFHRFVHGNNHYQWTRVLFGNKASPNMSQKVLDVLCNQERESSQAVETVSQSCYMDDCIDSRDTVGEIVALAVQLPKLLRKAGMTICKIYSNCREALKAISPELVAKGVSLEDRDPTYHNQRVLGLTYNAGTDELGYNIKFGTVEKWRESLGLDSWTKRSVLRIIASHYDPLGLAAPITIRPRKLLQTIWTTNLGWDDPLDKETETAWESALLELLRIEALKFPRWVGVQKGSNTEMHVYCDASSQVYACALYLREVLDGVVSVRLLAAKARVTPVKTQSVSRSELDACVLGSRMAHHFNTVFRLGEERIFFYTDSKNVLFWLTTTPKRLKVFVQRRVAEIQGSTNVEQWGHVTTHLNPADIATRDINVAELASSQLWHEGPTPLHNPGYSFQKFVRETQDVTEESLGEMKSEVFLANTVSPYSRICELADRVSVGLVYDGLGRMLRILTYVVKMGKKAPRDSQRDAARSILFRAAQHAAFPGELQALKNGRNPDKGSKILKLTPFLDDQGIIRSRSRLERGASLDYGTKYPVILSGRERIARLVLTDLHFRFKHTVGTSLVLAKAQREFIILGITRQLRRIANHCVICRKLNPQPGSQLMGPIPQEVIEAKNRAFSVTGIDFAGPFTLKGAGRGLRAPQRFVLVLTCMKTRGVHFEICTNQTAYAVVMALIRFACVRGDPDLVYSDNQTSFLAVKQELERTYERYRGHRVQWKTITPRAPHQGGKWERMVRSMKRALFTIGNSVHLKEEEFMTFLAQGADLLNSRPLSGGTGEDLYQALTPNHFLLGRVETGMTQGFGNTTKLLGEKYRHLEQAVERLWGKFIDEVLMDSREREKWRVPSENLKKGELVLVLDPNPLRK